ncbi:hypothetical protein [Flexivirga lutea]
MTDPDARVRFILNGRPVELSRSQVEDRLKAVAPDPIRTHAVRINAVLFPVRQAFEVGSGISRDEFTSHTARRHLAALGFELHGEIASRNVHFEESPSAAAVESPKPVVRDETWHTEANVQAAVVRALATDDWRILSVANTATKERGVDVIAERRGRTVGMEVKGFPSRNYADAGRASERKPTQPSTQAGHWYAGALLAAMRLRGREPAWSSVIALPNFPRYRDLHAQTAGSLAAAKIEVWWVSEDGEVTRPAEGQEARNRE